MAEKRYFICDRCEKSVPAESALNWIEVRPAGVDARRSCDPPIEGLYCSGRCLELTVEAYVAVAEPDAHVLKGQST